MTSDWLATLSRILKYTPLWMQIPLWTAMLFWDYMLYLLVMNFTIENLSEVAIAFFLLTGWFVICYLVATWRMNSVRKYSEHDEICAKLAQFDRDITDAKLHRLHGKAGQLRWAKQALVDAIQEDGNGIYSYKKGK